MGYERHRMLLGRIGERRRPAPSGLPTKAPRSAARGVMTRQGRAAWQAVWLFSCAMGLLTGGCDGVPKAKPDTTVPPPMSTQTIGEAVPSKPVLPLPSAVAPSSPMASADRPATSVHSPQLPAGPVGDPARREPETPAMPLVPSGSGTPPKLLSLHFEDAELMVVLRILGDAAGVNFLIGQGVKCQVTMKVDKLPVTEAWSIVQAILNANNLTAVKEGQIYKILPGPAAQKQPGTINFGRDVAPGDGFFTQIVPLQYLSAAGIAKVFEPLISQGRVVAHQETNTLILSGPAAMIKEIVQTVKTLDVPGRKKDAPQVFVYYVANAKAGELAGVLQTVFTRKGGLTGQARPVSLGPEGASLVPIPPMPGVTPSKSEEAPAPLGPGESEEGRTVGDVRIVPDERTNSLIIKATSHDYEIVKETIQKLDLMPRQVIIEVLVAEVALSDTFNLGIEWFIKTGMFTFAQSFGLGAGSGLTAVFVDGNDVRAFLTTLASLTNVNVVTSPHLLARDNKTARIQIGQEVPIVTGTQSTVTATAVGGENVFQTIQQRDIGRIMNITPHVTDKGQVTLDINLEISDTLPSSTVKGTPSFSKRSVNSSVVVEDRQAIMLGGIIDKSTNHTHTGIPWLRDIPYIGILFGTVADTTSRSELVIVLTPHVIATPGEGVVETERFKGRLDMLQKELRTSAGN